MLRAFFNFGWVINIKKYQLSEQLFLTKMVIE